MSALPILNNIVTKSKANLLRLSHQSDIKVLLCSDPAGVVEFEENFEKFGPLMFGFHDGQAEAPKIMAKKVKDFYLGEARLGQDSAGNLVDAISDSSYAHPIDTAAKIHALKSAAPGEL